MWAQIQADQVRMAKVLPKKAIATRWAFNVVIITDSCCPVSKFQNPASANAVVSQCHHLMFNSTVIIPVKLTLNTTSTVLEVTASPSGHGTACYATGNDSDILH